MYIYIILHTAKEKKDLEERLVAEYEKNIEDAVKKALENAKKTWSNCSLGTNVSTLCVFDVSIKPSVA